MREWVFGDKTFTVLNNALDAKGFISDDAIAAAEREEFNLNNLVIGKRQSVLFTKEPIWHIVNFQHGSSEEPK